MSFFGGAAVSLATLLVLPETPVQFGVLTFLGSAALLTIRSGRCCPASAPSGAGPELCPVSGAAGCEQGLSRPCRCPASVSAPELVCKHALRWTGLPAPQLRLLGLLSPAAVAVSFWTGFYLYRLRPETPAVPDIRLPGIGAIGRHSLIVYLLHQPVIYGLLALIFSLQEVHLCLS